MPFTPPPEPNHSEVRQAEEAVIKKIAEMNSKAEDQRKAQEQARRKQEEEERQRALDAEARQRASETNQR